MIKAAIDRVLELGKIETTDFEGLAYGRQADQLKRIKSPAHYKPEPLEVQALESLINYLASNPDKLQIEDVFLIVIDPVRVELVGGLQPDNDNARFTYVAATYRPPGFHFGQWMELEDFIIWMQSAFQPTEQSAAVVCMLGNMASERIKTAADDGFAQSIQVKTGLTTKAEVKVQNPVELVPFRTFREVRQPTGQFILRLKERGQGYPVASLFESDGAAWWLSAVDNVAEYLRARLDQEGIGVKVFG